VDYCILTSLEISDVQRTGDLKATPKLRFFAIVMVLVCTTCWIIHSCQRQLYISRQLESVGVEIQYSFPLCSPVFVKVKQSAVEEGGEMRVIARLLADCNSLNRVIFAGTVPPSKAFLSELSESASLKHLFIVKDTESGLFAEKQLLPEIRNFSILETLDISHTIISKESATAIATNRSIRNLYFRFCQIESGSIEDLVSLPNLKEIYLQDCNYDKKELEDIKGQVPKERGLCFFVTEAVVTRQEEGARTGPVD